MPPIPLETIFTFAKSLFISFNELTIASHVPATSVLIITLRIFLEDSLKLSNKSSELSFFCFKSFLSFSLLIRYSEISLAFFSFSTT